MAQPAWRTWPTVLTTAAAAADCMQASLDSIAAQTRVVLSTAGPFALLGTPVVDAAVRGGCHYVDITGGGRPSTACSGRATACSG